MTLDGRNLCLQNETLSLIDFDIAVIDNNYL
jgi:hypothetical protein